ncbi:MAG: DUF2281 domain-containing protein [Gloeocapsa sp. UFS-A4-WI-NPMV-4B04]|jgi:hypothetical protein|nr:DUF2281 domain-containing protein [Gloeocapsa sp. UFS-A4-WI-NPMV-4B04]
MNTKEQIIQEIEQVPEPLLAELLEFVRSLKVKPTSEGKAFKAYLESEEKWSEVYRRLADS